LNSSPPSVTEPFRMPDEPQEELQLEDNIHIVLIGPDGKVKKEETTKNTVVTTGKNGFMDQLLASPTIAKPSHIAVGTGTTTPVVTDTALHTELDRNALASKTRSGSVVTMVVDWAQGDATGDLTEAGIFNAASGGDLYARSVFSAIPKGVDDTLSMSWTFSLG
jgi:hypothetical protein